MPVFVGCFWCVWADLGRGSSAQIFTERMWGGFCVGCDGVGMVVVCFWPRPHPIWCVLAPCGSGTTGRVCEGGVGVDDLRWVLARGWRTFVFVCVLTCLFAVAVFLLRRSKLYVAMLPADMQSGAMRVFVVVCMCLCARARAPCVCVCVCVCVQRVPPPHCLVTNECFVVGVAVLILVSLRLCLCGVCVVCWGNCGTEDLARLFSVFGSVRSANVVFNKINHTSRCFGFVHFLQPRCACVLCLRACVVWCALGEGSNDRALLAYTALLHPLHCVSLIPNPLFFLLLCFCFLFLSLLSCTVPCWLPKRDTSN